MSRPIRDRSQRLDHSTEPNNNVALTVIPEARFGTMMATEPNNNVALTVIPEARLGTMMASLAASSAMRMDTLP